MTAGDALLTLRPPRQVDMLARSVCRARRTPVATRQYGAAAEQVWKTHGKPPLTKIVATIGPASEHMPELQQ